MFYIRKKLKRLHLRIVTAEGAPEQVAGGLAFGVFWGMSPLWGLQMILAFVSATLCNCSRIPALLAVHVSNFLTMGPIYITTWFVGNIILRPITGDTSALPPLDSISFSSLVNLAGSAFFRMLLGGVVVGAVAGTITYFLSLYSITKFRSALEHHKKVKRLKKYHEYLKKSRQFPPYSDSAPEQTCEPIERSA